MGESFEEIKEYLISRIPKLAHDPEFKITSPNTPNYNCIAWAYNSRKDCWMWPVDEPYIFDGVYCWWPKGVPVGLTVDCFVEAFKAIGYEVCSECEYEEGYRKIALYEKNGECTHASRGLTGKGVEGLWTTKLGPAWDIQHKTPYATEGADYGKVHTLMKLKL